MKSSGTRRVPASHPSLRFKLVHSTVRAIMRRSEERGHQPVAARVTTSVGFDDNQTMAEKVTTGHTDVELPMKVVGRRRWAQGLVASAPLLRLVLDLRGAKPFLPRGVHRFRTFEESEAWTLRMLARPPRPGRRS